MGEFIRERLPDWPTYAEWVGLDLVGKGEWRSTRCDFHGGSDSMRVNLRTGGWVCMACGAKGGDVLAHYMQLKGYDFVNAARCLGGYLDDGKSHRGSRKPKPLSASDKVKVLRKDFLLLHLLYKDAQAGRPISEADDRERVKAMARVEWILGEDA